MRPTARAVAALTLLVLLAPLLNAPGAAQPSADATRVLGWEYVIRVDDPASGTAKATVKLTGLKGLVEHMGFATRDRNYPILGVSSSTSRIEETEDGLLLTVKSDSESFTFIVDVNRPAHKADEFNTYLGREFGVIKAEAFALSFNYSYLEGTPFRWDSKMSFDLPSGWKAEAAYPKDASGSFRLPPGEVLPRGFIALGPFELSTRTAAGKEFRYARLGDALEHEADVFPFLEKATPYFERVYGRAADDVILVVNAPAPMLRGGLGATNSFFVHEESDLRTFAHEYAHVWQLFATVQEPPGASIWLNEGDADYHGALALFVTDYWGIGHLNDFLRGYHDERSEEPYRSGVLTQAAYGTPLEDVAYHKGALVLHALDALMLDASHGAVGVGALLRALNEAHDQRVDEKDADAMRRRLSPVTNEEVLETVNRLVQATQPYDFTPFFQQFVFGRDYPAFEAVSPRDNLVISNLTLTPDRAVHGEPVTATLRVENLGIAPATKVVPLLLDGAQVDAREVSVGVGRAEDVTFTFAAPGPGTHQVRSFFLEADLHVLAPPRLVVERVSTVPATLTAGVPADLLVYVKNAGELDGTASVVVLADGTRRVGAQTATVEGNVTKALSFSVLFTTPGHHTVEVQLAGDGAEQTVDHAVDVLEPDADADGVPDAEDDYPKNPRLTEKSVGNDLRNSVPVAGLAALAALGVAAAVRRKRLR